ncbi:tryptophan synthase beta subunit-like PLP-dependent enzyme [Atractiella rhizophila]|nr:tryptophan synthase beta subunit-like PLP-dependent enzyme [Atractiella rhizophila]
MNGNTTAPTPPLYSRTPLLTSPILSSRTGTHTFLKLENVQPSGSFKSRGISHFLQSVHLASDGEIHPIIASGGNAGLACACSAVALGLKRCTVVVSSTTSDEMIARLAVVGTSATTKTEVIQRGESWAESNAYALELVEEGKKRGEGTVYVPAFDDHRVVEGHASMVHEIKEQLFELGAMGANEKPSGVLVAVGGGGLIAGVFRGLEEVGWDDVPVAAFETSGAASFIASLSASRPSTRTTSATNTPPDFEVNLQSLPAISTIAGSLGAKRVSHDSMERALRRKGDVVSVIVSDPRAVAGIEGFARDHQILVEPACAAVTPYYSSSDAHSAEFLRTIFPKASWDSEGAKRPVIVVIVCGGSGVSIERVGAWKKMFAERGEGIGSVKIFSRDEQKERVIDA